MFLLFALGVAAATAVFAAPPPGDPFAAVDAVLAGAIAAHTFPGCVAVVLDTNGKLVYARAHGRLTYDTSSPVTNASSTLWDMASLTKIMGGTTAAAVLSQLGELDLDAPIAQDLPPAFCDGDSRKCAITARQLLTHSAGFPPDPTPLGWSEAAFACPATTSSGPPPALDFSCAPRIWSSLCAQNLTQPPGAAFVYSDLSLITLVLSLGSRVLARHPSWVSPRDMGAACRAAWGSGEGGGAPPLPFVTLATCTFEAVWRSRVAAPLGLNSTVFRPPASAASLAAPTWLDDTYRRELLQGVVSDENAYAAGGLAGHAGVFSTGFDVAVFLRAWMRGARDRPALLSDATIDAWTRVADPAISQRALGWSTNGDAYAGCGPQWPAAVTYTHTGYTGTEFCVSDGLGATALLAARVFPDKLGKVDAIHATRVSFNTEAAKALASIARLAGEGETTTN